MNMVDNGMRLVRIWAVQAAHVNPGRGKVVAPTALEQVVKTGRGPVQEQINKIQVPGYVLITDTTETERND